MTTDDRAIQALEYILDIPNAVVVRTGTYSNGSRSLVVACPYCGELHTHGFELGDRGSHCGGGSYLLVDPGKFMDALFGIGERVQYTSETPDLLTGEHWPGRTGLVKHVYHPGKIGKIPEITYAIRWDSDPSDDDWDEGWCSEVNLARVE